MAFLPLLQKDVTKENELYNPSLPPLMLSMLLIASTIVAVITPCRAITEVKPLPTTKTEPAPISTDPYITKKDLSETDISSISTFDKLEEMCMIEV